MQFSDLKGKKIVGYSHDADSITFDTDSGQVRFKAVGDCCSTSWIGDVNDLGAFPGVVIDAEEVDESVFDGEPVGAPIDLDVLTLVYFYKIRTDRGYLDITMYNNGNGYYGGWLQDANRAPSGSSDELRGG